MEYFTTENKEGFSFFAHPAGGGTMGKKNTALRGSDKDKR
jgi:hypothetical protein